MAIFELPLYPDPRFRYTIDLGGARYSMRFDYKPRLGRLFLSVYDSNDQPVLVGQGLAGGGSVVVDHKTGFPGVLVMLGPGRYTSEALASGQVRLFYDDGA